MKLSTAMANYLRDMDAGRNPIARLHGRSQHGGASGTRMALLRRGLIKSDGKLTDEGCFEMLRLRVGRAIGNG